MQDLCIIIARLFNIEIESIMFMLNVTDIH